MVGMLMTAKITKLKIILKVFSPRAPDFADMRRPKLII